jgi:tryptophanyl-tRNA synthetase
LNEFLDPIRTARKEWENKPKEVMEILHQGTQATRKVAEQTMHDVRAVMHLNYFE